MRHDDCGGEGEGARGGDAGEAGVAAAGGVEVEVRAVGGGGAVDGAEDEVADAAVGRGEG